MKKNLKAFVNITALHRSLEILFATIRQNDTEGLRETRFIEFKNKIMLYFLEFIALWKTCNGEWEYFFPLLAVALGDTTEAQKVKSKYSFFLDLPNAFSLLLFNQNVVGVVFGEKVKKTAFFPSKHEVRLGLWKKISQILDDVVISMP